MKFTFASFLQKLNMFAKNQNILLYNHSTIVTSRKINNDSVISSNKQFIFRFS